MNINKTNILQQLDTKYEAINQKTEPYLEGLLWSNPISYWDFLHTDALLSLQTQRTTLPDEMVFIMYHQINELLFKMVLWEIEQLTTKENLSVDFYSEKISRISRYFDMLTGSFSIMTDGLDMDQYMKFRYTLTPASGFQSAQYRLIEFAITDMINLTDARFRSNYNKNSPTVEAYENLYWQAAGKDYQTGQKSYPLQEFEKKYKKQFIDQIEKHKELNLWQLYLKLPQADQENLSLIAAMRHLDYTINITWVMQHYKTAEKYIGGPGKENLESTGGSHWRKYMHPKYQKRIFFPKLWSENELNSWGENL
jgi:tryptophan 2,3-dioxygenase